MLKLRGVYLAYDHGVEHGPTDFNDKNYDPKYILDIAKKGEVDAIVMLKGAAEKYYSKDLGIPLILKLNAKTKLRNGDPISKQWTSVEYAIKLGAEAIGYTIYAGSEYEAEMFAEFGRIQEEARKYGLKVILWSYPRGSSIKDDEDPNIVAYAARLGFELGADVVKVKYPKDDSNLEWIVKNALTTKLFFAGGSRIEGKDLINRAEKAAKAGVSGFAIGRNVWQSENPLDIIKQLKQIFK
jgi:class I fructose-bisphosphate aldolase